MFLHNHLSNNLAAHAFMLESHCTRTVQSLGSVAVDESTHYITLVYCDPFYELVLYSY